MDADDISVTSFTVLVACQCCARLSPHVAAVLRQKAVKTGCCLPFVQHCQRDSKTQSQHCENFLTDPRIVINGLLFAMCYHIPIVYYTDASVRWGHFVENSSNSGQHHWWLAPCVCVNQTSLTQGAVHHLNNKDAIHSFFSSSAVLYFLTFYYLLHYTSSYTELISCLTPLEIPHNS